MKRLALLLLIGFSLSSFGNVPGPAKSDPATVKVEKFVPAKVCPNFTPTSVDALAELSFVCHPLSPITVIRPPFAAPVIGSELDGYPTRIRVPDSDYT